MTAPSHAIEVLLVEDDPTDELITREAFAHNKIANTLYVAHDGREGLDYLYQRGAHRDVARPDLVLLDLPIDDGRQLLEEITSNPDLSGIPVVVLTTSAAQEDVSGSYQLPAHVYLTKPVDFEQFLDAVRHIDDFYVQIVQLPHR
jgi:CheY-like chemotaxis protein